MTPERTECIYLASHLQWHLKYAHILYTEWIKVIYIKCNPKVLKQLNRLNKFPRSRVVAFSPLHQRSKAGEGSVQSEVQCRPRVEGWGGQPQEPGATRVTCGAVHHVGRHAVGRRLGVHQPRAVVHGLAVGRAGSHESARIHARKAALPVWRESTCVCILTVHAGSGLPWQPFLIMRLCTGWGYYFSCLLEVIYFLEREAELFCQVII